MAPSVSDLDQLSNDELKKRVLTLVSIDDWSDTCGQCRRPSLLHKGGPCTRSEKESPEVILKIWDDFRARIKSVIIMAKAEITKIAGQNTDNMTKLVDSLKTKESKDTVSEVRTAWVTKPAKVPSWTKDIGLETYIKQVETWNDINKDVPPNTKYQDFMEGLKTNKEIKGLPKFVADHILPVMKEKKDQTVKKVLELLDIKYGRTQMEKIEDCVND